jgi:hypothetical protein
MIREARILKLMVTLLALGFIGCADPDISNQSLDTQEDGVIGRLFGTLTDFFQSKAEKEHDIVPIVPWTAPVGQGDPAVDELFDTMGLVEVQPEENPSYDGAMVGMFEHFPDPDDPDDFYDSVCFFAKSPDKMPSQETLFWAEMYGFRSDNGEVSDVNGEAIGMECVGCEEGNTDGDETRVIFYVNGIRTDTDTHCETLQAIANKTGAVTIGVLNETEGAVKDIWQTTWDRFTVQVENKLADWGIDKTVSIHENDSAVLLANLVVQRIRQGKHVEIWAHSQGGAVTSLALHRALRALVREGLYPVTDDKGEQVKDRIRVVTFGSAASQWPEGLWPKGPVYTHYVHLRDATPSALGVGAFGNFLTLGKKRAGGDANMVFFDGEPPIIEEEEKPDFHEIAVEDADVPFTDLSMKKYHGVEDTYFSMYEQKNGAWYR